MVKETDSQPSGATGVWHHLYRYRILYLSLSALAFGIFVTLRFPVYFHWDDVSYLEWSKLHGNPFAAFLRSESTLFGAWRPACLLAWWGLYHLFGLQEVFYQIFISTVYALSLAVFFLLLERYYSTRVALLSLLGYIAVFFHLGYVIFWFSDLSFVLEVFFINLSLYFLHSAVTRGGRHYILGVLFAIAAMLSKEPAAFIIPSVLLVYVLSEQREGLLREWRRIIPLLGLLFAIGIPWLLSSPAYQTRQSLLDLPELSDQVSYVVTRWNYYAWHLIARTGILLWIAGLFLAMKSFLPRERSDQIRYTAVLLAAAIVFSFLLKQHLSLALLVLVFSLIPSIIRHRKVAVAATWCLLPLLGLLTIKYHVRTLLVEASFGFAILIGIAGNEFLYAFDRYDLKKIPKLARAAIPIVVLLCALPVLGLVQDKLEALQVLSNSRQNFKDVYTHVVENVQDRPVKLALVSYGDMGLDYRKDIQPLGDLEKAHYQKTLSPEEIRTLLRVSGRPELMIFDSLEEYHQADVDTCYIWAMSRHEKDHIDRLQLPGVPVYEVLRGDEGGWLYLVSR